MEGAAPAMTKKPRSTIGSNPLDQVVPTAVPADAAIQARPAALERFSSSLPADLLERARNAVFFTPGATMAGLLEEGLRSAVDRLEAVNGGAFRQRASDRLRAGRQVKG